MEIERFIDTDIMSLVKQIQRMVTDMRGEKKNGVYYNYLNKLVKFSKMAESMFSAELKIMKEMEEEEKELGEDVETVSEYANDDSDQEDVDATMTISMIELNTFPKGISCEKNHTVENVKIIGPSIKALTA